MELSALADALLLWIKENPKQVLHVCVLISLVGFFWGLGHCAFLASDAPTAKFAFKPYVM